MNILQIAVNVNSFFDIFLIFHKSLIINDLERAAPAPRKCLRCNGLRSPAACVLARLEVARVTHEIIPTTFALRVVVAALRGRAGILLVGWVEVPSDGLPAVRACVFHDFNTIPQK